MESRTHLKIDPELCGRPVVLETDRATVELTVLPRMAADDRGLAHGGFIFGAADYAAMLAVNEPTVVLGKSSVSFRRPVVVGQTVRAEARVTARDGARITVEVEATVDGEAVFTGEFRCVVPGKHVLDR